ncbi:MAG TPA: GH116 family glycosyl hydrolase [Pyrinomonadaceae bacterium]|nr:GH116 family glycosyl hydrolase [Pyrinomonadaceae bacterium]
MKAYPARKTLTLCLVLLLNLLPSFRAQAQAPATPKFTFRASGLQLERRTQAGSFFDVVGRKSAAFGYEHRAMEAWVYPMKILDDFELSFRVEGYPLEFRGADTLARVSVRPEATVFTYSHAAFNVRQVIFAPVDEPGIIMLLDVDSVLPMTVTASFRPRLRLAWPAGLMTGNLDWNEKQRAYYVAEESGRFVGIVGSPSARDLSVMPYQEEPRDVPARFSIEIPARELKANFVPVVIAGGVKGREDAKEVYDRLLGSARALYEKNVGYYERLQRETVGITTPDERFDAAFAWAKVGVDKGVATNPYLGTGLVAGFRTSGESERPGFAWFFGRDAMWTALATTSYGDFPTTRAALEFLKKFQRADGKIPHEISQSASLIPWFTDYPYAWASADATPLYVIVHADYWRASGDAEFLRANWDSIVKAYRFTEATDTDGNGLVENTRFGHGWVEGGALYPPHEEIYMQGLWVKASRDLAEMADAMKDAALAARARASAERTRAATEQTYWLPERGFYAFATNVPPATPREAEPGPNRATRQQRMNELDKSKLIDEDTVLPAVPLWWGLLEDGRAQGQIDHLGSPHMATDWGARIISDESRLYDPLSYHHGSVWPLFTGWASVGAYRYGRPHVGHQALMANALLTYTNALGYVTELLSGDFNAPFGRSSHHQVWSEAMVITPTLRGMLGVEAGTGGTALRFAPQLPANWERVEVRSVAAGPGARFDLSLARGAGRMTIKATRRGDAQSTPAAQDAGVTRLTLAPAFPLDARVLAVTTGGRSLPFEVTRVGDVQRAEVRLELRQPGAEVVFTYDEGTDVYVEPEPLQPGARSEGLRVIRSRAEGDLMRLVLEGRGGRSYGLRVRTPREVGEVEGVAVSRDTRPDARLLVTFGGGDDAYVRRELTIPLLRNAPRPTR